MRGNRRFRVLRFLRLHRLLSLLHTGIMRQVLALLLIIFCSLFVLTGCVYQLESLPEIEGQGQFTERLSFFEAFYFVIITFTTVGYGDIYPQQIISRLIVAAAVPIMIIIVPTLGSQIYDLVASQSAYAHRAKIHRHGNWHHIVVVGCDKNNTERGAPTISSEPRISLNSRSFQLILGPVIISARDLKVWPIFLLRSVPH